VAIFTLMAAGYLTYSTTRAAWTDTVTVTNNQIQTGTADLQVSTAGIGGGAWDTTTKSASIVLTGLIPGGAYKNDYDFSLWNNSTTGVNFDITVQTTSVSGTGGADESKLLLALYENGQDPDTQGSGWFTLAQWQAAARSLNSVLNPGAGSTKDYRLAAKLDSTAGNEWQGKTVNMTFTVTGTQP
jgi:predicted ribosomally synthesized peptide with SipW-like signal peptide